MEILIKRINENAKLPVYSNEAGPGMDLYALGEVSVAPGETVIVQTGVAMAMPVGYVGLIWNQNSIEIWQKPKFLLFSNSISVMRVKSPSVKIPIFCRQLRLRTESSNWAIGILITPAIC